MSEANSSLENLKIPNHVAIIMDGNGRWATRRGLPRLAGHQAGTENLRPIITASVEFGIQYLTLYAFSTENWGRPAAEVSGLMHILADAITRELDELDRQGVQIRHIGRLDNVDQVLAGRIRQAVERTSKNSKLVLSVAFNYGGRDELLWAVRKIVSEGTPADQITEETISQHLFTAGIPDPDLIIRTSGEMRLSNFLIWQAAYSELYVPQTLWPDFNKDELRKAIEAYNCRDRRFGRVSCDGEEDREDAD